MSEEVREVNAGSGKFLMYKDKPLVRSGNVIYYGNMRDPYVVMMQIVNKKKQGDTEVSGKIIVQMISTDITKNAKDRIVRRSEQDGLYNAIDIASIWLNRANSGKA
ncbi:MAG: hypothetical protein IJC94_03105 [Oscillospiraceae bacterium]|nr:hypothetical protein [Oscillospiraceae bacterium]MBQ9938318.1 hypothetical protein [Oscillospiraceae bacterium]